MESTPAEELPALYRAILDEVARLEASGERSTAARIRRDATAAYSRAWDERARRRLTLLLRSAGAPATPQAPARASTSKDRSREVTPQIAATAVGRDG